MLLPFIDNKIVSLNLSHNAFGPIGIPGFDFLLSSLSSLKVLKLENDGLGPEGSRLVAEALLASNNKIESLSIGWNRLENEGFKYFAEVLIKMQSFVHLEMP